MTKFEVTRKQSVIVEAEDPDDAVHKALHDIDQSRWNFMAGNPDSIDEVKKKKKSLTLT